jgi:hypothetical protein
LAGRLTCKLAHAIDHIAGGTVVLEEDDLNTDSISWLERRMIECVSGHQETLGEKRKGKESIHNRVFLQQKTSMDYASLKFKWEDRMS